ncbi:hypothetical protein FRB99_003959 [Tulasnella sp. 403]|nr:hypothetical protein FRB99_003959 [Tulasnella sp. 403]
MPLLLGTKRSHAQNSSDVEDDSSRIASTSFQTAPSAAPSNSRSRRSFPQSFQATEVRTPSARQKRKLPRDSFPTESPNNLFRIGNEMYFHNLKRGPGSLPVGVTTMLELRLTLKRVNVYRVVQVPTSYKFTDLNKLILFFFGWSGESTSATLSHSNPSTTEPASPSSTTSEPPSPSPPPKRHHSWRLVRDVSKFPDGTRRQGEIQSSREWVRLYPTNRVQRERETKLEDAFDVSTVRIEDEDEWTVAKLWGPGGVFTERGAVYTYEHGFGSIVDITLNGPVKVSKPTDLPKIIAGRGAPMQESISERRVKEVPENKIFIINTFRGNAFERWLKGEVIVSLDSDRIAAQPRGPVRPIKRLPRMTYTGNKDYVDVPTELEVPEDAITEGDSDVESGPSAKRVKTSDPFSDGGVSDSFAQISSSNAPRRQAKWRAASVKI